ncbi:hypothetical protein [Virgibacillus halodenitrificans]|uniref:hypothetical protein n=1 Tax=Virgibacillus halodenitrificans TaxID=1482 RepID=UPI000319598C|nr:hypothetical protein [Virgibacillus halodenitrificans]
MNKWKLVNIGIISGLFLGGLLFILEKWSSEKVYVLLMNVDYIPVLKEIPLHPVAEFILHLIVSIVLVFMLYYGLSRFKSEKKVLLYIVINTLIGAVLFLTTSFSDRTPELTDGMAFFYWLSAHFIYGWLVGSLIVFVKRNN